MIVADNSLLAYYFIGLSPALTAAAQDWRRRDPDWKVPPLWRPEFRNVLATHVRVKLLTPDAAATIWRTADSILSAAEEEVDAERILALAAQSGCTAYDCEYVQLAQRLGVALVSGDKKLCAAFPGICTPLVAKS